MILHALDLAYRMAQRWGLWYVYIYVCIYVCINTLICTPIRNVHTPPTTPLTQTKPHRNRTGPLAATARALPSARATRLTLTTHNPAPPSSSAKKDGDGTQRSAAAGAVVSFSYFAGDGRRRGRARPPITPGQYYLVSVPAVAGGVGGEWHPFSVAVGGEQPEGPEEEEGEGEGPPVSFVVKDRGAWGGRGWVGVWGWWCFFFGGGI